MGKYCAGKSPSFFDQITIPPSICDYSHASASSAADNVVQMCECACVSVCNHFLRTQYLQSYKRIFMKFCGQVRRDPRRNQLDFGGDPDSFLDPGSLSMILYY